MENSEVFEVSKEDEEKLLKQRKCTPEKTKELVKELEEWFKTQPHLPQPLQYESFLEIVIMHCFYNVKLAKKRLDLYYTYKAKNKDFYEMFGDDETFVVPSKNPVRIAVLPKLYKNGERIVVIHIKNKDVEEYNFDYVILHSLALLELGGKLDRSLVHMYVVDCEGFDINWMKKTNASKMLRFTTHLDKGYCSDLAAIHLVNAGSAIQLGLNLLKAVISGNYLMKLHIHDSWASLHEMVDPKYLPEEFGGACGTTEDAIRKLDQLVVQNRDFLVKCGNEKFVADESKRPATNECHGSTFGIDLFF